MTTAQIHYADVPAFELALWFYLSVILATILTIWKPKLFPWLAAPLVLTTVKAIMPTTSVMLLVVLFIGYYGLLLFIQKKPVPKVASRQTTLQYERQSLFQWPLVYGILLLSYTSHWINYTNRLTDGFHVQLDSNGSMTLIREFFGIEGISGVIQYIIHPIHFVHYTAVMFLFTLLLVQRATARLMAHSHHQLPATIHRLSGHVAILAIYATIFSSIFMTSNVTLDSFCYMATTMVLMYVLSVSMLYYHIKSKAFQYHHLWVTLLFIPFLFSAVSHGVEIPIHWTYKQFLEGRALSSYTQGTSIPVSYPILYLVIRYDWRRGRNANTLAATHHAYQLSILHGYMALILIGLLMVIINDVFIA